MVYYRLILDFVLLIIIFFKQKTAYEMRISVWISDVCSSDLLPHNRGGNRARPLGAVPQDRVDMVRVREQALHLLVHRAEPGDGEVGELFLEVGELLAADRGERLIAAPVGQGGVDAEQVLRLGPPFQARRLARHRPGVGLDRKSTRLLQSLMP